MHLSDEWLSYEKQLGFRPKIDGSVDEIRANYKSLSDSIGAKLSHSEDLLQICKFAFEYLTVRDLRRELPAKTPARPATKAVPVSMDVGDSSRLNLNLPKPGVSTIRLIPFRPQIPPCWSKWEK